MSAPHPAPQAATWAFFALLVLVVCYASERCNAATVCAESCPAGFTSDIGRCECAP